MNKPSPMTILCEQTPVVILAGGKGTRLMPYTTALPKPLMPVGEYPILDILLRQLSSQGFRRITLAVGHLAGLIQAYFKQGQDAFRTCAIALNAKAANGTPYPPAAWWNNYYFGSGHPGGANFAFADGSVRFITDTIPLQTYRALATIASKRRTETVQFGVVEAGPNGQITEFKEKPNLDYLVSMGIYVFSPAVREYIPRSQKFDFPELVQRLLANNQRVLAYESEAYWMDIGRPDDYERANEDFPKMESAFLKANVESAAVGTRI